MANVSKSMGYLISKPAENLNREERRQMAKGEGFLIGDEEYRDEERELFESECAKSAYRHAADKRNFRSIFTLFGSYASVYYARMNFSAFESIYLDNKSFFDDKMTLYTSPGSQKIVLGKFTSKEASNVLKVCVMINTALEAVLNNKSLPNKIGEKITEATLKISKISDDREAYEFMESFIIKDDKRREEELPFTEIDIELCAKVVSIGLSNYYLGFFSHGEESMKSYYSKATIGIISVYYGVMGMVEKSDLSCLDLTLNGNLALFKKCTSFIECLNKYHELSDDCEYYDDTKSIVYEVMSVIPSLLGVGYDIKIAKKDLATVLAVVDDAKRIADMSDTECLMIILFSIVCSELYNSKLQITEGLKQNVVKEQVEVTGKREEELEKKIEEIKADNIAKQKAIAKRDSRIEMLEAEIAKLKSENKSLYENNEFLASELTKLVPSEKVVVPDIKEDESIEDVRTNLKDFSSKYKIVIVGGNTNLVSKLREHYPNITYVSDNGRTTIADEVVTGCDVLMVKADSVGHPVTFKIRSLAKKSNKTIRYISPVTNKEAVERSILSCVREELKNE